MQPAGSDPASKRNYIRRKQHLTDSAKQIRATLEFIRRVRGDDSTEDLQKQAVTHAESIEAVCWSPRARLSAGGYGQLMTSKTQELCTVMLQRSLPGFDISQLQRLAVTFKDNFNQVPPNPTFTLPIIPMPQPIVANCGLIEADWAGRAVPSAFDDFTMTDDRERFGACGAFEPAGLESEGRWMGGRGWGNGYLNG
jgi:hypothetical protein